MDCFCVRESAEISRVSTPIHGSSGIFFQTRCCHPWLTFNVRQRAFSLLKTSKISGQLTTRHLSPGRRTFAAPDRNLRIATMNVSDGCGDFIYSVVPAHFGQAV